MLSGRGSRNLRLLLLLTGAVWLFGQAGTVRAAGCHVPDRPVLARTLAWEHWLEPSRSAANDEPAAPHAIRPLPCSGETPTTPSVAMVEAAAGLPVALHVIRPHPAGFTAVPSETTAPCPPGQRLDRPPRPLRDG